MNKIDESLCKVRIHMDNDSFFAAMGYAYANLYVGMIVDVMRYNHRNKWPMKWYYKGKLERTTRMMVVMERSLRKEIHENHEAFAEAVGKNHASY